MKGEWGSRAPSMRLVEAPEEMHALSQSWRRDGQLIGFVPTMGDLHDGHLSLAKTAHGDCDVFVASIFVNPLQFGEPDDLAKYGRPFDRDCRLLRETGCDVVFAPSVEAMYGGRSPGDGRADRAFVEVERLGGILEGEARPGHFRGVTTIVAKLFNIVRPHRAYFGEKDYQQLKLIERMVHDLFFDVEIVPCTTVREEDGLAMSSRNSRLTPEGRKAAAVLPRALREAVALVKSGEREAARLLGTMRALCETETLVDLQYVAVVDAETLEPLAELDGRPARALIAASVGGTHLIDNAVL